MSPFSVSVLVRGALHNPDMSRTARASKGGICYHAMNRGNARATVFHDRADYDQFTRLMIRASERIPMRILSYCLMPNHFHFVVWPFHDGDLGRWMQWLLTSHVRQYHKQRGTSGRVWQGRFKAFPIQQDAHLLRVMRYVERNPLRANLVSTASDWPWSSLSNKAPAGIITRGPVPKPQRWRAIVDRPESDDELQALRNSSARNAPYGTEAWAEQTAGYLGLEASLRPLGRPKKQ